MAPGTPLVVGSEGNRSRGKDPTRSISDFIDDPNEGKDRKHEEVRTFNDFGKTYGRFSESRDSMPLLTGVEEWSYVVVSGKDGPRRGVGWCSRTVTITRGALFVRNMKYRTLYSVSMKVIETSM